MHALAEQLGYSHLTKHCNLGTVSLTTAWSRHLGGKSVPASVVVVIDPDTIPSDSTDSLLTVVDRLHRESGERRREIPKLRVTRVVARWRLVITHRGRPALSDRPP